jgi:RHS repeat-associated protein
MDVAGDSVGSLRLVSDASGAVVKRVDYDSFGNILSDSNPGFMVPFGFAGGLHDPQTGLVRFGYRDYDPDTGRWTAKDPIFFAGGDTDLFGYCFLVDPDGRFAIALPIAAAVLDKSAAYVGSAIAGAAIGQWIWDNWPANEDTSDGSTKAC